MLLGQIHHDGGRLEHPCGCRRAVVHQRRDLGVRVGGYEPAGELITLHDVNEPRVVLSLTDTQCQKLLKHHGNFDAVGCGE